MVALTSLSHGAGCGCKLPAASLGPLLSGLPRTPNPDVLVGFDTSDDAGVVRVRDDLAIVTTADFFTPIVDDPFDFGRIAATNALSDVYAMGGRPVVAVNLLGWPRDVLPFELAAETLRGGLDVCGLAGCHLAGGHSVDDPEPKYGLAVTGIVGVVFGKPIGPFWAASGAGAVVIGLALRNVILDIFIGLAINFDRAFEIGLIVGIFLGILHPGQPHDGHNKADDAGQHEGPHRDIIGFGFHGCAPP